VRLAVILAVVAGVSGRASAEPDRVSAPASGGAARASEAGSNDPTAPIFDQIAKTTDPTARQAAVAELAKVAPRAIAALGAFLGRKHETSVDDRKAVLVAIHAQVPDKNGRFPQYERKSEKEEKADDQLDWMAGLVALDPGMTGLSEVIADDAAIRALAATGAIHAAQLVFDAAFGDETIIYRDECGRYLRKMEPYAIPPLIVESQARNFDRKRYATYQLERLDRQEPGKALASATGDEALTIAIVDAFRTTHHREAVHAVWSKVNADSPRVRAKAREAWMAYITGPPPPPAPKKKLQLPGGKLTKKEKPLWLTYRELADNELRKAANELLGEDYPLQDPTLDDSDEDHPRRTKTVKVDLEELTKRLLDYYDDQRIKREADQWTAAKALADKGDLAGSTGALDRVLAQTFELGTPTQRADMAAIYFAWGKQLDGKQQWANAAAAYSKAAGLDPQGAHATEALAAHYYTLGKALDAQGKDGGAEFRRAIALRPDYAPAKVAEHEAATRGRPVWMLYAAGLSAAAAAALFALGMRRRRA
jgi:hypothetical protein